MNIFPLVIDESAEVFGIEAVSIVDSPAIESNFIALKGQNFKFKETGEKRILMGAALIPNKPIYRRNDEEEFYVYFTKETVRKAMELFMMHGNQNNHTVQHEFAVQGLSVVESWIVEGEKDKAYHYGLDVPVGTWMISVKVNNEAIWENFVKTGEVKGFSIEGYFTNKMEMSKEETLLEELDEILGESYADYPDGVKNNAKRAIEFKEKNGSSCGTQVGWTRASQLASGEALSVKTIKRMYSFLSRHEENYDGGSLEKCGNIMYLAWGGKAALGWSRNKLRELGELD